MFPLKGSVRIRSATIARCYKNNSYAYLKGFIILRVFPVYTRKCRVRKQTYNY